MDFIGGFQQPSLEPMSISIFGGGMPGGGIANFLQPLGNYLRNQVSQEQIDPFIREVTQMAQERFNLQGGGLQSLPVGSFNGGGPRIEERIMISRPNVAQTVSGDFFRTAEPRTNTALPTFGQQMRLFQ